MAEDDAGEPVKTEPEEAAEEDKAPIEGGRQAGRQFPKPIKSRCNIRIEELAKPKKWLMLGTWREFHCVFDPERTRRFKERLQEEFSMTPEETELYFSQLRKHARKMRSKKALEKQLKREKAIAKQEAYTLFKKRLRKALRYAFEHQPPVIVSPMLRDLSDNILEKLADLHNVSIPNRESTDKNSIFLVCIADWAAKLVSNIYYEVDAVERTDKDLIEKTISSKVSVCPSTVSEEEEAEEAEEEENVEEAKEESTEEDAGEKEAPEGQAEEEPPKDDKPAEEDVLGTQE